METADTYQQSPRSVSMAAPRPQHDLMLSRPLHWTAQSTSILEPVVLLVQRARLRRVLDVSVKSLAIGMATSEAHLSSHNANALSLLLIISQRSFLRVSRYPQASLLPERTVPKTRPLPPLYALSESLLGPISCHTRLHSCCPSFGSWT